MHPQKGPQAQRPKAVGAQVRSSLTGPQKQVVEIVERKSHAQSAKVNPRALLSITPLKATAKSGCEVPGRAKASQGSRVGQQHTMTVSEPRQNSADRLAKNSLDSLALRRSSLVGHSIARSLELEHTLDNTNGDGAGVSKLLHGVVKEKARASVERGSQSAGAVPRTIGFKRTGSKEGLRATRGEEL